MDNNNDDNKGARIFLELKKHSAMAEIEGSK